MNLLRDPSHPGLEYVGSEWWPLDGEEIALSLEEAVARVEMEDRESKKE